MGEQEQFSFAKAKSGGTSARTRKKAKAAAKSPKKKATKSEGRKSRSAKAPRSRATAQDMAKKQRDISVSEFFAKNRHLLGFDNPSKALLTTVKEGVDNSLDACEEAGHPSRHRGPDHAAVGDALPHGAIEDNGPGILRQQVPKIFGSLLYGSKFHRLRQSRGQQGIGISAAGMYGLLTTGKPIVIVTRTGAKQGRPPLRARDRHQDEPAQSRKSTRRSTGKRSTERASRSSWRALPRRPALRGRVHTARSRWRTRTHRSCTSRPTSRARARRNTCSHACPTKCCPPKRRRRSNRTRTASSSAC